MKIFSVLLLFAAFDGLVCSTTVQPQRTVPVPESKKLQINIPDLLGASLRYKISNSPLSHRISINSEEGSQQTFRPLIKKVPQAVPNKTRKIPIQPSSRQLNGKVLTRRLPPSQNAKKSPLISAKGLIYNRRLGRVTKILPKLASSIRNRPQTSNKRGVASYSSSVVRPKTVFVRKGSKVIRKVINFAARRNEKKVAGAPATFYKKLIGVNKRVPFVRRQIGHTTVIRPVLSRSTQKFLPSFMKRSHRFHRKGQDVDLASSANQLNLSDQSSKAGLSASLTVGARGGPLPHKILGYRADGTPVYDPEQTIDPNTLIRIVGYDSDSNPIEAIDYLPQDLPQGNEADVVATDENGEPLYAKPPFNEGQGGYSQGEEEYGMEEQNQNDGYDPSNTEEQTGDEPNVIGVDAEGNEIYDAPPNEEPVGDEPNVIGVDAEGNEIYDAPPSGEPVDEEVDQDESVYVEEDTDYDPNAASDGESEGGEPNVIGHDENGNEIYDSPPNEEYDEEEPKVIGYDENGNEIYDAPPNEEYEEEEPKVIGHDENGNEIYDSPPSEEYEEEEPEEGEPNVIGHDENGNEIYDAPPNNDGEEENEDSSVGYDAEGNEIELSTGDQGEGAVEGEAEADSESDVPSLPPITNVHPEFDHSPPGEYIVDSSEINANIVIATPGHYENLETLVSAVDGIHTLYNDIYAEMPNSPDQFPVDSTDEKLNDYWFEKAQSFAKNIVNQQEKLNEDINIVGEEMTSITLTLFGLADYFDLGSDLRQAESNSYSDTEEFQTIKASYDSLAEETISSIRQLIGDLESISPKTELLINECQVISSEFGYEAPTPQLVDSTVTRILPKIVEIKIEIDGLLSEIKDQMLALEGRRQLFKDSIDAMIHYSPASNPLVDEEGNPVEGNPEEEYQSESETTAEANAEVEADLSGDDSSYDRKKVKSLI